MKIYNSGKVLIGLVIFVGLVTFPFFYNKGRAIAKPEPKLDTPAIMQLQDKKCVEPRDFMRAELMRLLNDWRDSAVRDGKRLYVNLRGQAVRYISEYLYALPFEQEGIRTDAIVCAVKPYCWGCHIEPKENKS